MKKFSYLFIILFSFIGCSSTTKKEKDEQQSDKISIVHFDKDIYEYLENPDTEKEANLKAKYPLLLPAFVQIATNSATDINDNDFFSSIRNYFSHPMLQKIYKDELSAFNNIDNYEEELTLAGKIASTNGLEYKTPQFALHVSGFKENTIVVNNMISISADKYLGSDYVSYQDFFAPYQRQQMEQKYIVRDLLKAWLISDILKINNDEQQDLLSAMIDEGRILYILSVLLPDYTSDDLIGYKTDQSLWCKENEKMVWQKIVKQDNLFTKDHMIITRYINDAPYTSTISPQSPGRVGAWIGWQIVNQYAKKTGAALSEIITSDPAAILKNSKYNP